MENFLLRSMMDDETLVGSARSPPTSPLSTITSPRTAFTDGMTSGTGRRKPACMVGRVWFGQGVVAHRGVLLECDLILSGLAFMGSGIYSV